MKTKGRRCKKVQRVRILLRTLQIARVADTERFWEHGYTPHRYTHTPCFGDKRLKGVENKGSASAKAEKRACIALKILSAFLQRDCRENSWRRERVGCGAIIGAVMDYYTS
jgi:hypothetical protein